MEQQKNPPLNALEETDTGRSTRSELDYVLSRLFATIVPFGILFGGLALAVSIYRSLHYSWYPTLILHVAMYGTAMLALAFRRRLPGLFLFALMIALIGVHTVQSLFLFGLAGPSIMNLAMICVFTGIFFGVRAGIVTLSIGVTVVAAIGFGICLDMVETLPNLESHLKAPVNWIVQLCCMVTYVVPFIIVAHGMKERLRASIVELRRVNRGMEREIASRAQVEKKLHASEQNYRSIFQNAVEGIYQITPEGRLTNANASLARIAGYRSAQEMMADVHRFDEQLFQDPMDRDHFRGQLEARGLVETFTARLRRKDGSTVWVLINGRAVGRESGAVEGFEGAMEDITQRKRAALALKESEAKYRGLVEGSLFGFCIVQDGVFSYVNRRFSEITGYAPEEILRKKHPLELAHPQEKKRLAEMIGRIRANEWVKGEFEFRGIHKNGKVKTLRVYMISLDYMGRPAYYGAFLDVTNEKALESQLMHVQKMEALGTLTGGIAHDFNNILTALAGYGNMLQMELDSSDHRRIYADQILSATAKAARLTQSLLTFGRKQPLSLRPVNLNDTIQGTEKLLKRLITEDIALVTRLTTEDTVIMADPIQMDQILFNLATNARDAMPRGGTLVIETKARELDEGFAIVHGFGEPGRYALLSVSDTGTGMKEEIRCKVFDPFFTTKAVGKGTGLGLSTVYGIVKQHNGYITIYSEPGEGTSFHIYLPLIKAHANEEVKKQPFLSGGRETILIAEDDPQVREMMRSVLGNAGYHTIQAVDGEEAVRKFREHGGIELAILDRVMPEKNGLEVAEELRKINPELKAIFTSGYSEGILREKGVGMGTADFLPKPFSQQDLLANVREVLDRKIPGCDS